MAFHIHYQNTLVAFQIALSKTLIAFQISLLQIDVISHVIIRSCDCISDDTVRNFGGILDFTVKRWWHFRFYCQTLVAFQISSLAKMLSCEDAGASKNACFALSCLATNLEGHSRLLQNVHSDDVLRTLAQLLSAQDSETGWFAAM